MKGFNEKKDNYESKKDLANAILREEDKAVPDADELDLSEYQYEVFYPE